MEHVLGIGSQADCRTGSAQVECSLASCEAACEVNKLISLQVPATLEELAVQLGAALATDSGGSYGTWLQGAVPVPDASGSGKRTAEKRSLLPQGQAPDRLQLWWAT